MDVINEKFREKTLIVVIKKCVLLGLIVHSAAMRGVCADEVQEIAHFFAAEIANEDIPALNGVKPKAKLKRESSLSRLYNAVRTLSTSADKYSIQSRTTLEDAKDKNGLKELVLKVVTPLSSYLLKITQDLETYSSIVCSNIDEKSMPALKWKMLNHLVLLSKVSVELSRLAKYYLEELIGVWILINFGTSFDIAVHIGLF